VEDRIRGDKAGVNAHLQSVDDEAGAHVVGELPADDHSGGQVDHGGQVEPALCGFEVGDVADESLAGRAAGGVEVAADQIRRCYRLLAGDRGALVGPWLHRFEAEFAHQIRDQPDAALVALTVELGRDAAAPEGLPRLLEHPAHLPGQLPASRRSRRLGPVAPGVVRRARHGQHLTHPGDLVVGLLRLDERATLSY
jgi:hypothetical protein